VRYLTLVTLPRGSAMSALGQGVVRLVCLLGGPHLSVVWRSACPAQARWANDGGYNRWATLKDWAQEQFMAFSLFCFVFSFLFSLS
jgi:hypothetical protein